MSHGMQARPIPNSGYRHGSAISSFSVKLQVLIPVTVTASHVKEHQETFVSRVETALILEINQTWFAALPRTLASPSYS